MIVLHLIHLIWLYLLSLYTAPYYNYNIRPASCGVGRMDGSHM